MGKNILFICKFNRFRSKVAESYFNKINKNKSIIAKSAGIVRGSDVNIFQKKFSKEEGIVINNPPIGLSTDLLKWHDMMIIVADDVPPSLFRKDEKRFGKKMIVWKIQDSLIEEKKEVKIIINKIKKKVEDLVKELK